MRLRYLHLPYHGPLTDTDVVFGREEKIAAFLNPPRQGVLNFLVGINGTGKSSLLRAVYHAFRCLSHRQPLAIPITLSWDRTVGSETTTVIVHSTNATGGRSFVAYLKSVPGTATRQDWQALMAQLAVMPTSWPMSSPPPVVPGLIHLEEGVEAFRGSQLFSLLPKRLIVYTSGGTDPWERLDQPNLHPEDEGAASYQQEDERPESWTLEREWQTELVDVMQAVIAEERRTTPGTDPMISVPPLGASYTGGPLLLKRELVKPLHSLASKRLTNRLLLKDQPGASLLRIDQRHLRLAGITLALWQCAKEMAGREAGWQREALRMELLRQQDEAADDARLVLHKLDWFYPTHLSLTYRDIADADNNRQHQELLALIALADEVTTQPQGACRAVIALGPREETTLAERLKPVFPSGLPNTAMETIARQVDKARTGAEAFMRLFSADDRFESTPLDVFLRLEAWRKAGLLEDITLTIRRLHRPGDEAKADSGNVDEDADDREEQDVIVTYDQLSDGEQMLLGRMGLLFLLRGQDGSLLLLDEPETHFNDAWKREIVRMVDRALLESTQVGVLVATHTSIALTDAFAAEVTVLDKNPATGETVARGVTGGLFGTDPGEVTMNLFGATGTTGTRASIVLENLLATDWKGKESELEELLGILGSSFHRAELRALLKKLRTEAHGTA